MDNSAKQSKVKLAADWLAGELAGGPKRASELFQAAKTVGIPRNTLKRAKVLLRAWAKQSERQWFWGSESSGPQGPKSEPQVRAPGPQVQSPKKRRPRGQKQGCVSQGPRAPSQSPPLAPPHTPPLTPFQPSLREDCTPVKAILSTIKETNSGRARETSCSYEGPEAGQAESQPELFPSKPEKAPRSAASETSAEIGPKGPTWHEMALQRDTEREKQKRNKDPRFRAVVELWDEMFREKFGAKYRYFEKDFAQLKRLLRDVPEADAPMSEIERRMIGCFDAFQPWWTKTSCSLGNFCAQWNELVIEPNEVAMQPRYLTEDDRKRIEGMKWLKENGLAG